MRSLTLLAAAVLLSVALPLLACQDLPPAAAADRPKPKPAPPTEKEKAALAEKKLAELMAHVRTSKRAIKSLHADVIFYTHSPLWDDETTSKGTMDYIAARGYARLTTVGKDGQRTEMIENGPFLWRHFPGQKKAERYFQGDDNGIRVMMELLGSPVDQLKRRFHITLAKVSPKAPHGISLSYVTPPRNNAVKRIDLAFDEQYRPKIFSILETNGDTKRWTLNKVTTNDPKLTADSLGFDPMAAGLKRDQVANMAAADVVPPKQIAETVLNLVAENGSWPHGWTATFTLPDGRKGELTASLAPKRPFRLRTWKDDREKLTEQIIFDGTTLIRYSPLKAEAVQQKATHEEAKAALSPELRRVLQAVTGEWIRRASDFEAVTPFLKPQKNLSDLTYIPAEFRLKKKQEAAYGLTGVKLKVDLAEFHLTEIIQTDDKAKEHTLSLDQKPVLEPLASDTFAWKRPKDTKLIVVEKVSP